ncbi:MAG TPA: histone deacetylase, partial [Chroococcales cyanobacterium]
GIDKPFALDRGQLVLEQLSRDSGLQIVALKPGVTGTLNAITYEEPIPITTREILSVHSERYLDSLKQSKTWLDIFEFSDEEYSPLKASKPLPELIDDITLKCGGTRRAVEMAVERGMAASLGGGYHHAFPDRGRGFCVLHDVAIAIKAIQASGKVGKVMVVDLDFHQGDGTAVVFRNDPTVFTFSMHSQEGWPEEKQISDLDVPILESEQHLYIEKLHSGLQVALNRFAPELVLYVGGSDPYEKDVLPGTKFMKLPLEVMKERDFYVIDRFADLGIPLAMVFAGGYGPHVWEVHYWATRRLLERSGNLVGDTVGCN